VPIPVDASATIVPLSLIGERYVQLTPAWTEGKPRAKDGMVIPPSRTDIPVEPDEALAAVKKFIDTLDPDATGALVQNLADDLDGNGAGLNQALEGVAGLTTTFADKDQQLVQIIDHFDSFTATLRTKESQLGRVMDGFARTDSIVVLGPGHVRGMSQDPDNLWTYEMRRL
jgi:virulence factor Mce-like protein